MDLSIVKEKTVPFLWTMLFVFFIVMLPRYNDTAKIGFVLMILPALAYLVFNTGQLVKTSVAERLFFTAIIANFSWIALSFYVNGETDRGASFLWSRHFYILFVIPLFFAFRNIRISDKTIILSMFASIAISLADILIDLAQGVDHRFQGMGPNGFGPIQLCMTGILFLYFVRKSGQSLRWVALAGSVLGVANIIFSFSRSSWLTLVLLTIGFVYYLARSQPLWKRLTLFASIALLLAMAYTLPTVKFKVDYGIESVTSYLATDDYRDKSRLRSIGIRLELWKTAWNIFLEHPWIGVGVGGFKSAARENSDRYQVNEVVHRFNYVHNQYLATLATRGFPGLILFLLVLLIPVYIAMTQKTETRDAEVARLSIVFVCLTYLIGCFGEDHFESKSAIMFVGIVLPMLLAKISTDSGGGKAESVS